MLVLRIYSWNVNGIRSAQRKGLADWLMREDPDVLCVQETKASEEQVPKELARVPGYHTYFISSKGRNGYSGVGLFAKHRPNAVIAGLGVERFDIEGRVQEIHFDDFVLFNVYFPNGKASQERLRYKLDFYDAFLERCVALLDEGNDIIVCGDVNTAHKEIDLARPKANERISGFLPEERAWIDRFLAAGFIDSYRMFDPSPGRYTWWDMKTNARERNVGWRIDCFYLSRGLAPRLEKAFIFDEVMGSDHCPIGIELK
ncbi:MAG TPA: exodeoxyribonuclease III [Methanomassiliicoccales archaeon]|nr:exodeoxyribonuclease III [Methanomassiliicoccales archaeon]